MGLSFHFVANRKMSILDFETMICDIIFERILMSLLMVLGIVPISRNAHRFCLGKIQGLTAGFASCFVQAGFVAHIILHLG